VEKVAQTLGHCFKLPNINFTHWAKIRQNLVTLLLCLLTYLPTLLLFPEIFFEEKNETAKKNKNSA
jgi:hypothetical protein